MKRTTKALASRIQVDYLKRFLRLRYWRRIAIIVLSVLAAGWVVLATWPGKKEIHSPGPLSPGHKIFADECASCHTNAGKAVPNAACLQCHSDRPHHDDLAASIPRCGGCHVEHQGADLKLAVGPWSCAACHADLKRKDSKVSEFASGIRSLDQGHPEFRLLTKKKTETPAIKLNHKIHTKPGLEGPEGKEVSLACENCHEVDLEKDPHGVFRNAETTYQKHCQSCHALGFDRQFPKAVAPHEKPEKIRSYLSSFYREQLSRNPLVYRQPEERTLPGPSGRKTAFADGEEWLRFKTTDAERKLFGKTCLECHAWSYSGSPPDVAPVRMTGRFLHHGRFDHAAHRPIQCDACHTTAASSEKTSDLLVPGLETCASCHAKGRVAGDPCAECHRYHGEGLEKVMGGAMPVRKR